ncbi:52 kDa repressor of the inhibitor of the protein kinase-like 6 [Homarus americanus]|uniref:52 kDa repressor of the inhibitor of the protein kinase-like 6 n=1 Tax=Homarus americanus TaxID=6706 RepID=A0A8J5JBL3_HOMAM|nr:52 kDa repressor of the inhibitor of the protein kinase-like 6 [Homarus americanus]
MKSKPSSPTRDIVKETLGTSSSSSSTNTESSATASIPVNVRYTRRDLTDDDKLNLLTNYFRPDYSYKFPPRLEFGKQQHFQYRWLPEYQWLAYSEATNGSFCIPSVLYGQAIEGGLISRPFTLFTKSKAKLAAHDLHVSHKGAVAKAADFIEVMKGRRTNVISQMNDALRQRIANNRAKLASVIKTVIFCGRQNIPLRGHRDCSIDVAGDPSTNHGNFLALLDFRVEAGDHTLQKHFSSGTKSATYTSANIQNEPINICGQVIRDKIVKRVKEPNFYICIADEVTDNSNKEQLAMVLRRT